jgi:glycosyltransferase involved in cell wall biosynthesis
MIMSIPKVSVIMPVYNGAKYVGMAIESLLNQTLSDWELRVVDDGSADSTPDILATYNDPRIFCVRQRNGGEASARNRGLQDARGQYCAFLDADDLFLPDALKFRAAFLDTHSHYGVVVSEGFFCNEANQKLGRISDIRAREYEGDILEPLLLDPSVVSVPVGVTARRELLVQHGMWFDTSIGYGTDWDLWIRLARYTHFGYLREPTFLYRVHFENMTREIGKQKFKQDWVKGRRKILESGWFPELSEPTRVSFLYTLVCDMLAGQLAQQEKVFEHEQFQLLSNRAKAQLWRLVGADYLLNHSNREFAIKCLQHSVSLFPSDQKTRYLLVALQLGYPIAINSLRVWRNLVAISRRLQGIGHRRPAPIPNQLRPL